MLLKDVDQAGKSGGVRQKAKGRPAKGIKIQLKDNLYTAQDFIDQGISCKLCNIEWEENNSKNVGGALNHIKHFHKVPASRIKWTDLHTAGSKVEPEEASIQRRPEDIAREATPTQDKPKTRVDDLTIEKQV